jgi:hypothetical protein
VSRAATRPRALAVLVLSIGMALLLRHDYVDTTTAAADPAFPAGGNISDPFRDAASWASTLESYRFVSQVQVISSADRETFRTDGQVRDRGPGASPDLYALVRLAQGQVEVLRLPDGAWTRAPGENYKKLDAAQEGGSIRARRIADIIAAFRPESTQPEGEGSEITGTIGARAVGIQSTGQVPATLHLDGDSHLVRLDYTATFEQNGQDARLEAVTVFSDFNVPQDWPAPPTA